MRCVHGKDEGVHQPHHVAEKYHHEAILNSLNKYYKISFTESYFETISYILF